MMEALTEIDRQLPPSLSQGALRSLVHGAPQANFEMVLQVLDVKEIQGAAWGRPALFRVFLSDGVNTQVAFLGTQLNEMVTSNHVVPLGVVVVEECVPSTASLFKASGRPIPLKIARFSSHLSPIRRCIVNNVQNHTCVPGESREGRRGNRHGSAADAFVLSSGWSSSCACD